MDKMAASSANTFDAEKRGAFCLAMERTGEISAAAAAVNISRTTVYDAIKRDPEFAADVAKAKGRLLERLLGTAKTVAIEGIVEKFYDKDGNVTREVRRYDTRVLLAWLKRLAPEWGDRVKVDQKVEHTGTVEHQHSGRIEVEKMTTEQRDAARAFLATLPAAETTA